mmetsp:Transcript_8415/g.14178  ORF Transcript_8415/g.14178 Transcript_8415/m.14178 type:complete len:86 (+) Transcript_8415:661-918(+)
MATARAAAEAAGGATSATTTPLGDETTATTTARGAGITKQAVTVVGDEYVEKIEVNNRARRSFAFHSPNRTSPLLLRRPPYEKSN